jgi:hypothetical protein
MLEIKPESFYKSDTFAGISDLRAIFGLSAV